MSIERQESAQRDIVRSTPDTVTPVALDGNLPSHGTELSQRQMLQIKYLIRENDYLGDSVKDLAREELSLLLTLSREFYATDAVSSPRHEYLRAQIHQSNFPMPGLIELREVHDILLQVQNPAPRIEPEEVENRIEHETGKIWELEEPHQSQAEAAYRACGGRSPVFALAINSPEELSICLGLTAKHLAQPEDSTLLAALDHRLICMEEQGIRPPLLRELRRTLAALHDIEQDRGPGVEYGAEFDEMMRVLAEKISRLDRSEQRIATAIIKQLGIFNILTMLAVESPTDFMEYVQARNARDRGTDSEEIRKICEPLEELLSAQGIKVPAADDIAQCVLAIDRAHQEQHGDLIRQIQNAIDEIGEDPTGEH